MARQIDPEAILSEVLEHMPERHQAGRGPVEARRWLQDAIVARSREGAPLSDPEVEALMDRLEAAIARRFGAEAAFLERDPERDAPPARKPSSEPVDPAALEETLRALIADAFSAPTDGSPERAEILARRARGTVRDQLSRVDLAGFRRLRLRARAERIIAEQAAEVGGTVAAPFWARVFG